MADVQSGLATLGPNGWEVTEPDEGGRFGPQVSGEGNVYLTRRQAAARSPMTVSVRNPLAVASTNEPVGVFVRFKKGEVPAASYLRVYDASGNIVPWQWDPARHPTTHALCGTYSDGSLRAGRVWFLASFTAGQVLTYSIAIGSASWGDSFSATVSAGTDTVPYFQASNVRMRFATDRGGLPKSFRVGATATDYSGSQNGMYVVHQLASGTTKISYTTADLTGVTYGEIGGSNFGAGVVYREWECAFAWAAETGTVTTTRLRLFGNNRVIWNARTTVATALASQSRVMRFDTRMGDANVTATTTDVDTNSTDLTYSDGRVVVYGHRYKQDEYPLRTTETHSPYSSVTSGDVGLGWSGTTSVPAGAFFAWGGYLSFAFTGAAADERLRCHNPVRAVAARSDTATLRDLVVTGIAEMARCWEPVEAADTSYTYAGSRALAKLALAQYHGTDQPTAEALGLFLKWCSANSVTPSDSASWHNLWNVVDKGTEFIGPAAGCLPKLRASLLLQGNTTDAATVTTYIHALADFVVLAEATSGGSGQLKLRGSAADAFNSEGVAMWLLAESLSITADATRSACLTRIATRFASGYELGNKMPYSLGSAGAIDESIQYMRAAYHFYGLTMAHRAHQLVPCLPSTIDLRQFALEFVTPTMACDWYVWDKQQIRRGLASTPMTLLWLLLLGQTPTDGDWQLCADICEHLLDRLQSGRALDKSIDGHVDAFDGTISAAWGGSDSPAAAWHALYELTA